MLARYRDVPAPAVRTSGILTSDINVYKHVCTVYVQCMYNAIVKQLKDMVHTIIENQRHVHTHTDSYIPSTDMFEPCTSNVQTCISKLKVIVLGIFNVYTRT